MERIFYYDFYKIERDNKRWGYLISAIIHLLLLLLLLRQIFPMEADILPPGIEKKELIVELQMPIKEKPIPGGGSSAGPESEEPKEGGSKGSEAPPALEEMQKQPPKVEVIKPTPIPVTSSPKPILSAPEPSVVKADPPKVIQPVPSKPAPIFTPTPTKSSPPVVSAPSPTVITNPKPTPATGHGTGGSASTGDNDSPAGGTGGSGSGSGTGSGSGGANTGSGTGGGGNAGNGTGTGSGDGVGVNFDEEGPLKRKVSKREDITGLAREYPQSAVFNICINRDGRVTYLYPNQKLSKTKDKSFMTEAYIKMNKYEFAKDPAAPKKECGLFTFKIDGIKYGK